jgi:choline dehydrogenase
MGPDGDEMAVVDDHCRLRGIDNLFIADASVMPTIPRANINLPTMMIGERVAEFVRSEL